MWLASGSRSRDGPKPTASEKAETQPYVCKEVSPGNNLDKQAHHSLLEPPKRIRALMTPRFQLVEVHPELLTNGTVRNKSMLFKALHLQAFVRAATEN